jgi:hypothetical protein
VTITAAKVRTLYVYRLVVTLPEGSDEPGWRPEEYDDQYSRYQDDDETQFRWPRRRLYLSSEAAHARANLLRRWGADVKVERSEPVTWDA